MSRRILIRLQLLLLAGLVALVMGRGLTGRHAPADSFGIGPVDPYDMDQFSFSVGDSTSVEISATGSLESDRSSARLAAYAWLVRRNDHQVVWQQSAAAPAARSGTLVHESLKLELDPGTYDLYFAAFGRDMRTGRRGGGLVSRLVTRRPAWEKDRKRWSVNVTDLDGRNSSIRPLEPGGGAFVGQHVVWSTAPMGNRESSTLMFEVEEPVDVRIFALGEIQSSGKDYGWLDDLTRRRRVWELGLDNSTEAGGHAANRKFDGVVRLEPGVYSAAFQTDAGHAFPRWLAAPPHEPNLWGITLTTDETFADRIRAFDPRQDRDPLLELTRVGSSRHERVAFSVDRPLGVLVAALGEMRPHERYDYGWIENAGGERVWEMRYEGSTHAGGADRNREVQHFLTLHPGEYVANYKTDDSHAYGDWRSDHPRRPEDWGMRLFPTDRAEADHRFQIIRRESEDAVDFPIPPAPSPPVHPGHEAGIHIQIGPVGNDQRLNQTFELLEASTVEIHAQGELTPDARYDYGWIERAENGQTVWEMTWANTEPAGTDDRNRRFRGEILLPAGSYFVRYISDPSHAFGDFGKIAPDDPSFWGITVRTRP